MIGLALWLCAALAPGQEEPKTVGEPLQDAVPVRDRWRIPFPDYPLNQPGNGIDPYHQNTLKGDYPILGQNIFAALTARSDTTIETRRVPTPSGVSAAGAGRLDFFGEGEQLFFVQDFAGTVEVFKGETAFRPRDWEVRVTGILNYTYLEVEEHGIVNPNVDDKKDRPDRKFSLQEALAEYHLLDLSDNYDFVSVRAGIQPFVSDFRGLLFSDTNLGARLFGTLANNRVQWNLVAFDQLEKDTNSDLNTHHRREQQVYIANLYVQDFLWPGYTAQVSFHYSRDDGDLEYDDNDVLVRPALIGAVREHDVDALFFGWAGDGHIGRLNLTHAVYAARGKDEFNQIAGGETDIAAHLAALEVSYDIDWLRLRGSFLWASGDKDVDDDLATGFDSIFEAPNFAGGTFSFWNRQAVKLQGVNLVNRNSHLPDLRSSKTQGQMNFVNPGLFLYNAGADLEILPELRAVVNASLLRFQYTEPLESFTQQRGIHKDLGFDVGVGLIGRPLLNNNVQFTLGTSAFFPGTGFGDLFEDRDTLYSVFAQLSLTY
ncbi:MAG TPA: hypothetical protein VF950_25090 [Planctomycetota bacterium]